MLVYPDHNEFIEMVCNSVINNVFSAFMWNVKVQHGLATPWDQELQVISRVASRSGASAARAHPSQQESRAG